MIRGNEDLQRSLAAQGDLYAALAALRREHGADPASFALLAEGPLHAIAQIQRQIDEFTGAAEATRAQASLWLRLAGPRARWGETPASIVTAFLDALRKGVQSIAGSIATGTNVGRPTAELQFACDFEVAQFAEGSFEIGVRLPDPAQGDLFPFLAQQTARIALQEFLVAAAWAASPLPLVRDIEHLIPSARERRVVLRALKQFVPRREGGVHFVELYGEDVPSSGRIHLTPEATTVLAGALSEAVDEHEEVAEGDIREMDLDKRAFRLHPVDRTAKISCEFGEDLLPIAADLLGKRVRVVGIRRSTALGSKGQLVAIDIEKIESRRRRNDG